MTEPIKNDRREYYREVYRRNRAHKLAKSHEYHRTHRAEINARVKRYREANWHAIKIARQFGVTIRQARTMIAASDRARTVNLAVLARRITTEPHHEQA